MNFWIKSTSSLLVAKRQGCLTFICWLSLSMDTRAENLKDYQRQTCFRHQRFKTAAAVLRHGYTTEVRAVFSMSQPTRSSAATLCLTTSVICPDQDGLSSKKGSAITRLYPLLQTERYPLSGL